jgi:hypothetical protein
MLKIALLTAQLAIPVQLAPLPPLPGLEPLPPLPPLPRTYIDTQGGSVTVQPQPGGGATAIDGHGRMTIVTPDGLIIRPPR